LRIIHTSDWHLDSVIYGKRSHADQLFATAMSIPKIAKEQGATAIINSGDTLNSSKVGSYPIHQLDVIHEELITLGIPMYTLTGNHDMDDPQWISRYNHESGNGIVSIDNKTVCIGGNLHVHGFMSQNKAEFFQQMKDLKLPKATIGVWHGGIVEFTGGGNYPTAAEILNANDIHTWLMGDIHVHKYIESNGKIIGYPGPIGMIDVTENPVKYVELMDIDPDTAKCTGHSEIVIASTPLLTIPVTTELEFMNAEALLKSTQQHKRVIWFHFTESMEACMNHLMTLTTPQDVVRHKNITPRMTATVHNNTDPIIDSKKTLQEVGEEAFNDLPTTMKTAGMSILNRTSSHQAIIEKLITSNENPFN
jgi:DNA repair exonuclease SbcCD nuclease subunit